MLLLPPRHPTPTFRPFYPQLSQNLRLPSPQSLSPTPTGASTALRPQGQQCRDPICCRNCRGSGHRSLECKVPLAYALAAFGHHEPAVPLPAMRRTDHAMLYSPCTANLPALSLAHMGPSTVAISSLRSPTTLTLSTRRQPYRLALRPATTTARPPRPLQMPNCWG